MTRAGSVDAHSRSDLASAPPSSHTASISAPSSSLAANPANSATLVCGTISTNTTWLLANSPYEVCSGGVTISPTATLTIQPGVTVQFATSAANQLHVRGVLSAIGTLAQPITFTGVVAIPGSWGGLNATNTAIAPARVNLDYVTLDYGGVSGSTGAQLYADQAVVTITHSLIRNGGSHGVYVTISNPQVNIHDTSFISNTRNAIQLDQPKSDILMSGLSASGNGVNAVFIQGSTTMNNRRRWAFTGIPYVINGPVTVATGGALSIEPGSELQFTANGRLAILGELKAIGLPDAPITLTGQIKIPGAWEGLTVSGAVVDQAIAQLDYVTIEYGGSVSAGANIVVGFGGQLVARHSLIRFSSKDGVRVVGRDASVSVLNSQIVGNTLYGVFTTPSFASTSAVLATNNWWGDANGPTTDVAACSAGRGDRVTSGVLFRPVLTSTNLSAEFPLSDAPILTLTPRRWFAPADGTTKVFFDITLRDGSGAPLPGRAVNLSTSLGTATSGGITDQNGKTLAFLVSNSVGDANVNASIAAPATCEAALSPKSKVTFSTPVNITNLFPGSAAPYFDGDISVTPLPVVVGITTTIHAKLTNPLTVPITVDVSFGFVQSSIGLAFGPIKDIVGQVIPANSSVTLTAPFVPIVSGHYCVQVSYNITAIGSARFLSSQASSSDRTQRLNLNAYGGPMGSPGGKDSLNKADKAFSLVSKIPSGPTQIQKGIIGRWWGWAKDSAKSISKALGGDPPRQDYNQTTLPVWRTWPPVQPGANVSTTRAAAMNAASTALADVNAYGTAATVALDRYGGASEANNLEWAALQANARLDYEKKMAEALLTYADNLEAFVQVLVNEGEPDVTITVSDVISYQQRLATSGLTTQEIADAKLVGLTDAEIEEYRLGVIAANPDDISGNVLTFYTGEAAVSRRLGNVLLNPSIYAPGLSVTGGGRAGLKAATASGNTLAQIYENVSTVQLANPLAQTATIDVRARRVGLPADWMVSVSPAQVVLAPGEQTTVTVRIVPGSPTPQGSIPRVAIEGYAGSQLLGGIAVDVVVPKYVSPSSLANISTRLRVETDDNVLIGGFIITGTEPKRVIVRAIGPSLGFEGALEDPQLEIFDHAGAQLAVNDNWQDAPNQQEIFETTIPPTSPLESAYLATLNPGNYTAVVSGVNGRTGVGLVEVYDLDRTANSELANISTRGLVQTGDDVMIGGLIVLGPSSQKVIVRAIGASLPVEGKLADPQLELYDGNGTLLQENDNWRTGGQEAEIIATTIPPSDDRESAIVRTLPPAAYTAIVRGVNDTIGVALVEVYALE